MSPRGERILFLKRLRSLYARQGTPAFKQACIAINTAAKA